MYEFIKTLCGRVRQHIMDKNMSYYYIPGVCYIFLQNFVNVITFTFLLICFLEMKRTSFRRGKFNYKFMFYKLASCLVVDIQSLMTFFFNGQQFSWKVSLRISSTRHMFGTHIEKKRGDGSFSFSDFDTSMLSSIRLILQPHRRTRC